jgi:SAM-dependent methyltransferase
MEYAFSRLAGKSLVVAIEHQLPKDGVILDYGAGDGDLVRLLAERGYAVAAFEPSEQRKGTLLRQLSGVSGFRGVVDARTREQFDVVLMVEVIEHILDESLVSSLRRVHGLLKDGGTLIVTTPNSEDLELGMAYCPVSNLLFHRWQHVRSFTAESLSGLLGQHGFSPLVVHHLDFHPELYVPYDPHWSDGPVKPERPAYLEDLRADVPAQVGGASNLLFIGRKAGASVSARSG